MPFLLAASSQPPGDLVERVRAHTRQIEFDYAGWTLDALWIKLNQMALGTGDYLPADARRKTVIEFLSLVAQIQQSEALLNELYANPQISDPEAESAGLRRSLADLYRQRSRLQPLAESILQSQISATVSRLGLSLGGQPAPPVLYHSTPLPMALIISPRDVIRQEGDISLLPGLPLDLQVATEDQVDENLDVSSLVVQVGGVGVYPTMVYQTSLLEGLSEVVAHEWVHNFLTLRPLGMNYLKSPELRIINETTASIAGKEIGRAVLESYYPELIPPEPAPAAGKNRRDAPGEERAEPVFDYYQEMRVTRVEVDQLLAEGKIEEAEQYMEERRVFFWENGYRHLRKINQAYFAFYGAYADHPSGGAAGEDPVGAAVRSLRAQSPSLAAFLKSISWVTSFEQLQKLAAADASVD